ncbi:MAG: CapA family protein [Rhodospirillaceae bacterium]|nr:CapA family protein [Rhodospirillaceae bacterium]
MKWSWMICAAAVLSASIVGAAERSPLNKEWRGKVAELGQPAADEIVLTVAGDAIWLDKFSDSKDARLQALFEVMRAGDISFINFEMVTANSGYPTIKEIAKSDPSIVKEFVWAGTDVVSLANNHMMDFGSSGLETTRRTLDDAGIKHSGAGVNLAEAFRPTVVERKGLKMALVSVMVSPTLTIGTGAGENSPGVAWVRGTSVRKPDGTTVIAPWESDLKAMEEAIRAARKQADLVAVSLHIHWGGLDVVDPDGKQVVARAAVDAGADIILGHGPHVINGIEFYKSKPILYSIGNFACQFKPEAYTFFPDTLKIVQRLSSDPKLFESMIVRMVLSPKGEFRRMELLPVELTPDGIPHFVTGDKADAILAKVKTLSDPLGTKVNRNGWYSVVDLPLVP